MTSVTPELVQPQITAENWENFVNCAGFEETPVEFRKRDDSDPVCRGCIAAKFCLEYINAQSQEG